MQECQIRYCVWGQVNLADDPSREDYAILEDLEAIRLPPVLDPVFAEPQAWESVSLASVEQLRRPVPQ